MIEVKATLKPVEKVKAGDLIYWIGGIPFKLEIIHSYTEKDEE